MPNPPARREARFCCLPFTNQGADGVAAPEVRQSRDPRERRPAEAAVPVKRQPTSRSGTTWTETRKPADLSVLGFRPHKHLIASDRCSRPLAGELVEPLAKPRDFGLAPLLENFPSGTLGALARPSASLGLNRT